MTCSPGFISCLDRARTRFVRAQMVNSGCRLRCKGAVGAVEALPICPDQADRPGNALEDGVRGPGKRTVTVALGCSPDRIQMALGGYGAAS